MAYTVREASARILAGILALPVEHVPLRDALGRVLAEDVVSPIEHPPWDNSSMDGYAVRAADVAGASETNPVVLPVLETVRAGQRPSRALEPGWATRIMTGAPVPDGTDSVIRVEDTDGGENRVAIRDARDAHRNVRPRGEDLRVGSLAVERGAPIGPAQLGVLASVGCALVPVHRLPRVAVLASGDELVDVDGFDAVLRGERIVSSNNYTLTASSLAAGATVVDLGIVPDDPRAYAERLEGAAGCDLLITSGGVSVGAFDFTKDVLQSLGAELHLWRVRMRPGAPLGFGTLGSMPWLGLPGNPVSAMVTFELFARPLIRTLRGDTHPFRRTIDVRAREDIAIAAPLTHFMRAIVEWEHDGPWARLTGPQGSGLLTSMARANALAIVPADRTVVRAGETVRAVLLDGAAALEHPRRVTRSGDGDLVALKASLSRRYRVVDTPVCIGGRDLSILHPVSAEDLIDERDFDRDERLPYWAELWPSSYVLGEFMMGLTGDGQSLLELGCGSGIVSVCAALAGFNVAPSDYYDDAVRFARVNAWRNGTAVSAGLSLDWRSLPVGMPRFDTVVASDVLYEQPYGGLVARAIDAALTVDGVAYVADPGRVARDHFIQAAAELGLRITKRDNIPFLDGPVRQTITIFHIRRDA